MWSLFFFFFVFATLYCLRLKTELFRIHSSLPHLKSKAHILQLHFWIGRRLEILVDPFPRVNPKVAWPKAILSYISLFYYNLRTITYKLKHVNGDRIQFNTSSVHTYLAIYIQLFHLNIQHIKCSCFVTDRLQQHEKSSKRMRVWDSFITICNKLIITRAGS